MYGPIYVFPAQTDEHIKKITDVLMNKYPGLMVVDLRTDKSYPAAIGVHIDPVLKSATLHKLDPQAVKSAAAYL